MSVRTYRIKEKLKRLKRYHGRGTELVSLYIKPNKQITEVIGKLREERETSSNIKSDKTKKNVQDALTKIIQKLKYIKHSGDKGIVLFCGHLDLEGWILQIVEPIKSINLSLYQCDDHFHVEYLLEMLETKETYGIILVDSQKTCIALLRGNTLEILERITSGVEGKHSKGGQSQRRFERQREERLKTFFKRTADHVNETFLPLKNLRGILVGGCGFTKDKWVEGKYLDYRLQKKILKIVSVGYSDEQGLKEVIEKSNEFLKNIRYVQEKEIINSFLDEIGKDSGLAVYGEKEIMKALNGGKLKLLILSESLAYSKIEELSKIITKQSLIEIVSNTHESGQMLLKSFSGIAGISYFPLNGRENKI